MSTTVLIDGSSAPDPAAQATPGGGTQRRAVPADTRLSFGGILRSERIKLLSLRSIRITLALTVLGGLALSALIAWVSVLDGADAPASPEALRGYLTTVATFAAPFLALIVGVLGVFAMANEYSSGMILSTLTAVPRRGSLFLGKALVTAAIMAVTAIVLVVGGVGIAVVVRPDAASELLSAQMLTAALGYVVFLVLIALFAFGVASLLRSTAGGIAVVAGVTFVLPVVFQALTMTGWEWVPTAATYLPQSLGSSLAYGVVPGVDLGIVAYWPAMAAMAVWAAVTVIPAVFLFRRRDAH